MKSRRPPKDNPVTVCAQPLTLGIEAGGTRTSVLLVDADDLERLSFQTSPAVLPLMSDRELLWHLRDIAARLPFMSAAPRPHRYPSMIAGSKGAWLQRSSGPVGTTSV